VWTPYLTDAQLRNRLQKAERRGEKKITISN
jgi:hypothetical protein